MMAASANQRSGRETMKHSPQGNEINLNNENIYNSSKVQNLESIDINTSDADNYATQNIRSSIKRKNQERNGMQQDNKPAQ